ncbi:MAG: ABC transporter ATP-binding protein [Bdellovibrionales bacterium]|nr:ABC transporter ATP-binding protein [Bdellovibrionales bacterium]
MIKLEHVSRCYGDFYAVKDLNFEAVEGEIFGFLGVNGAGKTTTLRMITGVLQPSSGTITLGGYNMATEPEKAKSITGYIPDRPYLYPKLTAREFLDFVADLYRVPVKEVPERIEELLSAYGLIEWQHELIESFSHGMKQRLATAAALIHKPKILVIDEPMVGLDPHGAQLLKQSIRDYAKLGMTILLSTHSLNVAEEISDRIAIIDHGKILTIGTMEQLRERVGGYQGSLEQIFLQLTATTVNTERERKDSPTEVGLDG